MRGSYLLEASQCDAVCNVLLRQNATLSAPRGRLAKEPLLVPACDLLQLSPCSAWTNLACDCAGKATKLKLTKKHTEGKERHAWRST
eukprot:2485682-Amphidinium_carterae.1